MPIRQRQLYGKPRADLTRPMVRGMTDRIAVPLECVVESGQVCGTKGRLPFGVFPVAKSICDPHQCSLAVYLARKLCDGKILGNQRLYNAGIMLAEVECRYDFRAHDMGYGIHVRGSYPRGCVDYIHFGNRVSQD